MKALVIYFFSMLTIFGFGQNDTYEIHGELIGYQPDSIFLGYYFGDKQYLLDTALVSNGKFIFTDQDRLHPGVYLVVMPPDNKFFQIIITSEEKTHFSFSANMESIENTIVFENSLDNSIFYENLAFIAEKKKLASDIQARGEAASDDVEKEDIQKEMETLTREVLTYQQNIVNNHPGTISAALIKSGFNVEIPTFDGSDQEVKMKRYLYFKKHYFDHLDLKDDRLLRTPKHVLFDRVQHYTEKLTSQHPDSLIISLDHILNQFRFGGESYKYFLIHFLNQYAQSKIIGMDAVYVHLVDEYYAKGRAPWVEQAQLDKIIDEAKRIKPTLIGKSAPNFRVQLRDNADVTLYELKSPYTVLIFWAHDCSHCKKSMPALKEFYDKYRSKGVEIMAICTKVGKDEPACWDFIDEAGLNSWINASDKNEGRSFVHSLYNLKTTPKVFVLDQDKKIISKGLGTVQLEDYFDYLMETKN